MRDLCFVLLLRVYGVGWCLCDEECDEESKCDGVLGREGGGVCVSDLLGLKTRFCPVHGCQMCFMVRHIFILMVLVCVNCVCGVSLSHNGV